MACTVVALVGSGTLLAQTVLPAFDAASVKLNRSGASGVGATTLTFQPDGRFTAINEPLWRLIARPTARTTSCDGLRSRAFLPRWTLRTGLTGSYTWTLEWAPDDSPDANGDLPSLMTALVEQLD